MDKILVVDDEKGVCHSFRKILGRHGYDVITASNGIEAIEKTGKETPDIVVMDVSMPKMDGLETLQRLKSLYPDIIVIMMTAFSTSEKAITAMKHGAYDYLTKPFDNAQLISLLEKAIMDKKMSTPVTFDESDNEKGETIFPQHHFTSKSKQGNILIFPSLWPWSHSGNFPVDTPKYIVGSYLHYVD